MMLLGPKEREFMPFINAAFTMYVAVYNVGCPGKSEDCCAVLSYAD